MPPKQKPSSDSSKKPSKKLCHGRKSRLIQGSSSTNPNGMENEEVAPFQFPEEHDQLQPRELAPDNLGHISDMNYRNEELTSIVYRCRILRVHCWWSLMFERKNDFAHVREVISRTPFSSLVSLEQANADNQLIFALLQRWWPTTHTFHLPATEIGITPIDFTMLSGLSIGVGEIVPFNIEFDGNLDVAISIFPTLAQYPDYFTKYGIKNSFFEMEFMNRTDLDWCARSNKEPIYLEPDSEEEKEYILAFLCYFVGGCLFATAHSCMKLGWCAGLLDFSSIGRYDWGGATLAHLYSAMDRFVTSGKKLRQLTGFYWILQFWWYEYLASCNPILMDLDLSVFPRVLLWESSNRLRVLGMVVSNLVQAQQVIETRTIENIRWHPWVRTTLQLPLCQPSIVLSQQRVVLASSEIRVWYLGDRCARQVAGLIAIPFPPPRAMNCVDLTFAQVLAYRPTNWPESSSFMRVTDAITYTSYWRRVSRGSLSLARVARVANVDVVTAEALRPECRVTYPVDPDVSSQGPYPIRDTQMAPQMDDYNLSIVSSQGLPISLAISPMDPSSELLGRIQSYDEATLRHQYGECIMRENAIRSAAREYSEQCYDWLQEERDARRRAEEQSAEHERLVREMEIQMEAMQMHCNIEPVVPRRRGRPPGSRGRGHGSSQGSAPGM